MNCVITLQHGNGTGPTVPFTLDERPAMQQLLNAGWVVVRIHRPRVR